jgi:hypothetical protein
MILRREGRSALRNTCHSATLSTTNLTRTDLKSAKGRRGTKFGTHSVHTHAPTGAGSVTLPRGVGDRKFCTAVTCVFCCTPCAIKVYWQ